MTRLRASRKVADSALLRMVMALESCAYDGALPIVMSIARAVWPRFDYGSPDARELAAMIDRHRPMLEALYRRIAGRAAK